mgnify:CR=1 FL=1
MKKILALVLATAMVLSLAACGGQAAPAEAAAPAAEAPAKEEAAPAPETEAPAAQAAVKAEVQASSEGDKDFTVAGIVFQDDQFMNMLTKGYVDAATDAGVKVLTDNTNNDQAKETELINTYLAQGVAGLAIAPLNSDASVAALKAADEQGMKVALTNISVSDASFIVGGYTSDDYTNCQIVGKEAAEILKDKFGDETVKIAIVQFKSLLPDNSGARVKGYLDALDAGGVKYEVVADQDAWLQDTALETASAILTAHPETQCIITVNDGGTIGSVMAVQNAGLSDQVVVFGHDGSDQISSMVLDDACPLQAVIAQDPYGQGYKAMTAVIKAVRGEDVSDTQGKCQFLDGILLTSRDKDAVNQWRVDNGFEAIQ